MAITTLSPWDGAPGEAATVANTGYAAVSMAGGSAVFYGDYAPRNRPSLDVNGTDTAGYAMGYHNIPETDVLAYDQPNMPVTIPASEQAILSFHASTDARQFSLVAMSDGSVMIRDGANVNAYRSAAGVLSAGAPIVPSIFFTRHASAGTFRVAIFNEDGITLRTGAGGVPADSGMKTGQNTGSLPIARVRSSQAKSGSTSTVVARYRFGRPRWDPAATNLLPAFSDHRPILMSLDGATLTPMKALISLDGTTLQRYDGPL